MRKNKIQAEDASGLASESGKVGLCAFSFVFKEINEEIKIKWRLRNSLLTQLLTFY